MLRQAQHFDRLSMKDKGKSNDREIYRINK